MHKEAGTPPGQATPRDPAAKRWGYRVGISAGRGIRQRERRIVQVEKDENRSDTGARGSEQRWSERGARGESPRKDSSLVRPFRGLTGSFDHASPRASAALIWSWSCGREIDKISEKDAWQKNASYLLSLSLSLSLSLVACRMHQHRKCSASMTRQWRRISYIRNGRYFRSTWRAGEREKGRT